MDNWFKKGLFSQEIGSFFNNLSTEREKHMATDLSGLNPQQYEAVINTYEKNTVLVAGAGSGKTFVLKSRVSYLVDDLGVDPSAIMVVTFTNKAAGEIKKRLSTVSSEAHRMWLGTFHSICVKVLRLFGEDLGIKKFTILDEKDGRNLIRQILEANNLPSDMQTAREYLGKISSYKNNLIPPSQLLANYPNEESSMEFIKVYDRYQQETWQRRLFDFDDLICYTVRLLQRSQRVRDWFHFNIKYVMVDESQDTNSAQFELIRLMVGPNNLLLVGDDDQSIYSFRDAKPEYILNFERIFPDSQMLKLEQNYRSTQKIIHASNCVIEKNTIRSDKRMFTQNETGSEIICHTAKDNADEANWIVEEIKLLYQQGVPYEDQAVLYRTNGQSRSVEEALLKSNIPYHIVGGFKFYDRKEIKDLLAFFKLRANPKDDVSFKRVLSLIPRVGKGTIDNVVTFAKVQGISLIEAMEQYSFQSRQKPYIKDYLPLLTGVYPTLRAYVKDILHRTSMVESFMQENDKESGSKLENIREFVSIIVEQEMANPALTLEEFVHNITLTTENDKDTDKGVTLMTVHSSKGLEYEYVYIVGVEEDILPHRNSSGTPAGLEEERRLMYVGMTRAKTQLYLLNCESRIDPYSRGISRNKPSRFLDDIPKECIINI